MRVCRIVAITLGVIVLLWQAGNAYRGRFVHPFLAADLVAGCLLVASACWRGRGAPSALLAAFCVMAGVFLAAGTAPFLEGTRHDLGRALTLLGLIPCVLAAIWLIRGSVTLSRVSNRE